MRIAYVIGLIILQHLIVAVCYGQKYQTEFEKKCITSLNDDDEMSLVKGLLALDSDMNDEKSIEINDNINSFIKTLNPESLIKKPLKTIAKTVFNEVHKTYFKKYELIISFDQIFSQQKFNCVSGTALYALIFDRMGIDYKIVSEPGHVYLYIYNNKEKIIIESTDPVSGYKTGNNNKIKEEYVSQLITMKIISRDEFPGMNNLEIYNSIFLDSKEIPLRALVAYQYQNKAIQELSLNKYENAINNLLISQNIFEDNTTKDVLNLTFYYAIAKLQKENGNVFELSKYYLGYILSNDSIPEEMQQPLVYDLCDLSNKIAIEHSSPDSARLFYNQIKNSYFNQYPAFNELKKCVNQEIARYYILKKEYTKLIPFLIPAYSAESTNALFETTLFETFSLFMENLDLPDPDKVSIEEEPKYYLNQLKLVIDSTCLDCNCCEKINPMLQYHFELLSVSQFSYSNQGNKALEHLKVVESLQKEINFSSIDKFIFGQAYKEMWAFYTRQQDYETANFYLDEGLKMDPTNKVLKSINRIVTQSNKK